MQYGIKQYSTVQVWTSAKILPLKTILLTSYTMKTTFITQMLCKKLSDGRILN